MPRRFELVVFDWDGTLIDSAGAIAACIQAACRDLGLPVPDDERASHVIGLGLTDALSYAVPSLPPSEYGRLVERYRVHFLARDPGLPLFPGTRPMLEDLRARGHALAIATGKSSAGLARALAQTGLASALRRDALRGPVRLQARAGDAARADGRARCRPGAHSDDRRHLARPADGRERGRRGRGGELRRAPGRLRSPRSIRSRWSTRPRSSRRGSRPTRSGLPVGRAPRRRRGRALRGGTGRRAASCVCGPVCRSRARLPQPMRTRRGGARLAAGAVFRCRWHAF